MNANLLFGLKVTLECSPNKEFLLFDMEEVALGRPSVLAGDSVIASKPGSLTGMGIGRMQAKLNWPNLVSKNQSTGFSSYLENPKGKPGNPRV